MALFAGYVFSIINIGTKFDSVSRLGIICAAVTLFAWIIAACLYDFGKSLLVGVLKFSIIFLSLLILDNRGVILFSPEYRGFAISWSIAAIIITAASFYTNRLAIALTNILFSNSRLIQGIYGISILTALIAARSGGLTAFQFAKRDLIYGPILEQLSQSELSTLQVLSMVSGLMSGLVLWCAAWWANKRRNVPWHYPDVFRDWALIIGSWRGTSFRKLDLSRVSFRGATLSNSDLRASKLYRTCFQGASGLERARVDSRYLDLEVPKVQKLLTHACSDEQDFSRLSLRGAYLQGADLRRMNFTDTDFSGADLSNADLRGAILIASQMIDVDFTNANLTGVCIKNWSVNDQTIFSNVLCDYVYRDLDDAGELIDRYPANRDFEPGEFESLHQELENVAELVFKEGVNWRAFSFSMQKLDLDDGGMGLELKGFERKGDRWVVRVTHNPAYSKREVEHRLLDMYEDMKGLMASKEQQINQLLGITSTQADSIKELSQKPFGNSFFITGSTITNLTGSGEIQYIEAAGQVRSIVSRTHDPNQLVSMGQQFLQHLKSQEVATTPTAQVELLQQVMLEEAETDPEFRQYLLREGRTMIQAMGGKGVIARAIYEALVDLKGAKKTAN